MSGDHLAKATPKTPSVSVEKMTYGRTAARITVATAVWSLWDRLKQERNVDQQWLADRLGKSKSRVSRLMKGPGNWTLDTVGDLLEAMGGRLTTVEAHSYDEIVHGLATIRSHHHVTTFVHVQMKVWELETDELPPASSKVVVTAPAMLPTSRTIIHIAGKNA